MTKLEQIIKEDLPAMLAILKEKFAAKSTFKTFKSDNGELSYEGELAIGTDIFAQHNPEQDACIMKEKKAGKTQEEAEKMCMTSGKMERVIAPTSTYKHEDGTEIVVEAGKIVSVKKPETPVSDYKAMAEELFKAFPKTDLTSIESALAELKTTLATIQTEKAEMKAKIDKFDSFKTEVIGILDKFSKTASATPAAPKKTDSSKSIFNNEMKFEDRIKLLQETQI